MTANFLKQLRDAAASEVNPDKRYLIRSAADLLQTALKSLAENPTVDAMIEVNGIWAYADRALKAVTPPAQPSPPAASAREQQRRAA